MTVLMMLLLASLSGPAFAAPSADANDDAPGMTSQAATSTQRTAKPEGLRRLGRMLLHRGPDGEFDGYRLRALREGSLLTRVGLRNGDLVHEVNGLELTSLEAIHTFMEMLQQPQSLAFRLTREGTHQTRVTESPM